jgi:hypothetical protein
VNFVFRLHARFLRLSLFQKSTQHLRQTWYAFPPISEEAVLTNKPFSPVLESPLKVLPILCGRRGGGEDSIPTAALEKKNVQDKMRIVNELLIQGVFETIF